MTDLATLGIDAHGGLERWRQLRTISPRLLQGGILWKLKGQEGVLDDVHVTVDLRQEWASHRPFGQPDRRSTFMVSRIFASWDQLNEWLRQIAALKRAA